MDKMAAVHVMIVLLVVCVRQNEGSGVEQTKWRKADVTNITFAKHLLFTSSVRSKADCGGQCSATKGCVTFTFTLTSPTTRAGTCRGHFGLMTSQCPNWPDAGSMTYHLSDFAENWLESSCISNNDCPVLYSECFKGQCVCTPGYYYSNCSHSCVDDCPASDLLTSYVRYSDSAIAFNYIDFTNGLTEDECMESCSSTDWCRTVEYQPSKSQCQRHEITTRQIPASDVNFNSAQNCDLLQRMCI